MAAHERFHLKTVKEVEAALARLGLQMPLAADASVLAEAVPVGTAMAANRFAVHPMEGFDAEPDGGPGPLAFRRYERYASGGSAVIWFEATAVVPEGRSNPRQLCLCEGNVAGFGRLAARTRATARERCGHEPILILQLTHSGRYSRPDGAPSPVIAHHSAALDARHGLPPDHPLITDDALDRLPRRFADAARLAAKAGFDGVDVKSCHGYLVSELLASFTRSGRYGGPFENRTRFLLDTLRRIREEAPGVFATTRMSAFDGIAYPFGFGVDPADPSMPDLREPAALAAALAPDVPILNVSIGNPYFNPHLGRPFDRPARGTPLPEEHPLESIVRFQRITRAVQLAAPRVPVIASGYAWLRHLVPYAAAAAIRSGGAAFIGQGRGAFAYPDSPRDVLRTGRMDEAKCCIACSACTDLMRRGEMTGCVVRDREVYGAGKSPAP